MYVDQETGEVREVRFRDGTLNYDTNRAGDESALHCKDVSLAQQHQKDEADINFLVQKFGIERVVEMGTVPVPMFVDVGDWQGLEFSDMVTLLQDAQKSFMKLPARVRGQFENDPAQFVAFVQDPANIDECVRMGLAIKKESSSGKSDAGSGGTAGSAEGAPAGGVGSNGGAIGSGS